MMSRGVYRGIHSSLLDDPDFQLLSANARLVLLTARLCKDAGPAVIFRYYPEILCRQTGLTRHRLNEALEELAAGNWAYSDGVVLWVRNGLRHDPQVRLSDRKHLSAVLRQLDGLPSSTLAARFRDYYKIGRASGGPSKGEPGLALRIPIPNTDTEKESENEARPSPVASPPRPNGKHGPSSAAVEGWTRVEAAIKAGAPSPEFRDPHVAATLERIGGWARVKWLGQTNVKPVERQTTRAEFMQVYDATAGKEAGA